MNHAEEAIAKRLILLIGPPRVGKTTVVQKVMARSKYRFRGFFTLADNRHSRPRSFTLVAVDGRNRFVPEPDRFLLRPTELEGVSTFSFEELETRGLEALDGSAAVHDVVVIDELGALQLHSAAFRQRCTTLLDSTTVVLATAVSTGSSFLDDLRRRPDCRIFDVSVDNRCVVPDQVTAHLHDLLDDAVEVRPQCLL